MFVRPVPVGHKLPIVPGRQVPVGIGPHVQLVQLVLRRQVKLKRQQLVQLVLRRQVKFEWQQLVQLVPRWQVKLEREQLVQLMLFRAIR
jgi:hypothetical protein|eukprot:COSAG06_NODE_2017_length_7839_cov_128.027003_1_plen_89_part_00